ncbi:MAG: glycosyltransferase family 4 protein, partial [Flavobacteriaceae bacterium]|nr:glycosyltransferase family 4 protein [Flavobacteriaceae bacterium]
HNTSNRRTGIFFRISDRIIYGRYLKIVAITEEIKTILISKLKCKSGKISVIPNGIDLTEIKNAKALDRTEFKLSGQHRILLQVSSFTAQKDPQTPIRSLVQLPKDHVLLLVGDGETKAACKRLVTELGLDKRVLFLGVRLDVPSLLKTADIVILSSHFEGLSLSSIEGMASGRPFIASEVPGLSKLVRGAGILFPKGDAEYLASEITKLLSDADYHDATVRSCLKRAEEYSLDRMLQEHLTLYNTL